jgi:hypothetical protein
MYGCTYEYVLNCIVKYISTCNKKIHNSSCVWRSSASLWVEQCGKDGVSGMKVTQGVGVDLGCSVRGFISLHVGFGSRCCGMKTLCLVVSFAVVCRRGQLVLFNCGVPVDWVVWWYEMPPLSAMPQSKWGWFRCFLFVHHAQEVGHHVSSFSVYV